jgi:hypothetical protein
MPPGEEYAIERMYREMPSIREHIRRFLAVISKNLRKLLLPASDGAAWHADPQVVNVLLLAVAVVLLTARFLYAAGQTPSPRRIARRLRRRFYLRPRRISERLTPRLLTRVPPRLLGRLRRPPDFNEARLALHAALSSMVGLEPVKAHLSRLLDRLEMDAQRCASDSKFVSRRGCLHMVFLGNPGISISSISLAGLEYLTYRSLF